MSFTVAIDGPAAAGKGTISKAVAVHFGFAHLDTGLLYRAVGRKVLDGVAPLDAAAKLSPDDLTRTDLRMPEVAQAASKVAAIGAVRAALFEFQQTFARRDGGAVLDGRDIGTVICPDADIKLFVTASAEIRAARRYNELVGTGVNTDYETVLQDVKTRDARDAGRIDSPMLAADDAVLIDTSDLSREAAITTAIDAVTRVGKIVQQKA